MAAAAAALAGAPSSAQELRLAVAAQLRADDNLYRVPSEARAAQPHSGRDLLNYISATGTHDRIVGPLVIHVQADIGQSIFLYNRQLNLLDYGALADLSYTASRGSVTLSGERRRRPISFEDTRTALNLKQEFTRVTFDASRDMLGYIRLVGRASYLRSQASGGLIQRNDNEVFSAGGGLGYYSPTGNYVTLEYLTARSTGLSDTTIIVPGGNLLLRQNFNDATILSRVHFAPTALTTLTGSVGYSKHDDRSLLNRDFSGLVADVSITWLPTPSLKVMPSFRRSFGSETQLFSNGIVTTVVGGSATAMLATNLTLEARVTRERRNFRYDLQRDNPLAFQRTEDVTRTSVRLSYNTGIKIAIGVGYDRTERAATIGAFAFTDNAVTISLSRPILSL